MKINIYYGGRGVLDDPTLYVIETLENTFLEMNQSVSRYNIYEYKNSISALVNTIVDADALIFATSVEWLGIGGNMMQFLDALWFYGSKDELAEKYMMPVVISTTYGERESLLTLENAWEILGGIPYEGLCGYVEDPVEFKENKNHRSEIQKKAENMYRAVSQHRKGLPNSNKAVSKTVLKTQQIPLTPQESEQLSKLVANDDYVQKQKQDIVELSSFYRNKLGDENISSDMEYIQSFKNSFKEQEDFQATYSFGIEGKELPLFISVDGAKLVCEYKAEDNPDVLARLSTDTMNEIVAGRLTFNRAFFEGSITIKGAYSLLRRLDHIFRF